MSPVFASRSILYPARRLLSIGCVVSPGISRRCKSTILAPVPRRGKASTPSVELRLVREIQIPVRPDTLECWIDASTKHGLIAVIIGNTYKIFRLKEGWEGPGRNNYWAEMIAFELLIQVLLACQYSGHVTIYSDSRGCLGIWGGGITKVKSVKECNDRLQASRRFWPFITRVEWVSGKVNPADPFSRGRPAGGYVELRTAVTIPLELEQFVHRD